MNSTSVNNSSDRISAVAPIIGDIKKCTKSCCYKFRQMNTQSKSKSCSTQKSLSYSRQNSYKSTYSQEFGLKPFSPSHKIIPRKAFTRLSLETTWPPVKPQLDMEPHPFIESATQQEQGLLKRYQYQTDYTQNYIDLEPLEMRGEKEKKRRKQQRLMSVFQQDYQIPQLTERLRTVKQPRPPDQFSYLPLIPPKIPKKQKTSYVSDYCHQKLPKLDTKTDKKRVQFRAEESWINNE